MISFQNSPKTRPAGFTLIEMMVALVILAVGITGTMRAVNASTQASAQSKDTMVAASLAQQVLNEKTHTDPTTNPLQEGSDSGDFGQDYPGYTWESSVAADANVTGLLQVNVAVLWQNGFTQRRSELSTYYLSPPETDTTTDTTGTTTAGTTGGTTGG
jgi:general secretion pathway protein I